MQKLFRENHEILLMNCTYKINKYKMSLLIIIEVISLNIIFYVDFYFMEKKRYDDYIWVLKALKRFYDHLNLRDLKTIYSDNDKTLISALFEVFKNIVNHVLYV